MTPPPSHTLKSFDVQLAQLNLTVTRLGESAKSLFSAAVQVLARHSDSAATQVIADAVESDHLYDQVNREVMGVLALNAPVADDLRYVVAVLKIAANLHSIARAAASIARGSIALNARAASRSVRRVKRLGDSVFCMIEIVWDAYVERDVNKAMDVWEHDREVDEQHSGLFRELLTYMMEEPRNIATCSQLLFIAKSIERVGDYATNMAEMVHFMVTGRAVDEPRPKGDSTVALS
jgi:phosphate transport system protein